MQEDDLPSKANPAAASTSSMALGSSSKASTGHLSGSHTDVSFEDIRSFASIRPDPSGSAALGNAIESDAQDFAEPRLITDAEVDGFKEQDRFLPIANVGRIMKRCLPNTTKVSKEAKECVQECTSEFISFITSEAVDRCSNEKRKTINGEDVLFAMTTLGFENYSEALKIYLTKYREHQRNTGKRVGKKNKQVEGDEDGGGAEGEDPPEGHNMDQDGEEQEDDEEEDEEEEEGQEDEEEEDEEDEGEVMHAGDHLTAGINSMG